MQLRKPFSCVLSVVCALAFAMPAPVLAQGVAEPGQGASAQAQAAEGTGEQVAIDGQPAEAIKTIEVHTSDETYVASEAEVAQALATGVQGMPAVDDTLAAGADVSSAVSADDGDAGLMAVDAGLQATKTYKVTQVAGADRYATAAQVAQKAYPNGVASKTAIIAGGEDDNWPDSLATASLAGAVGAPILYVSRAGVPKATKAAIVSLGINKVMVVGGTASVPQGVRDQLTASGLEVVEPFCGEDRYDTQRKIYDYGVKNKLWKSSLVIVAAGYGNGTTGKFADALAASPLAFKLTAPVVLCAQTGEFTEEQLESLNSDGFSATTVLIVGGTEAVPESVSDELKDIWPQATVERQGGNDRYETSGKIAQWAVDKKHLGWNDAGFASGSKAADALSGSVLQGDKGSVMLLVDYNKTRGLTIAKGKGITSGLVYGGTEAVSSGARGNIATELGFKVTDIEGYFKVYIDAGHGWNNTGSGAYDSGATGNGYYENTWSVELSRGVAAKLKAQGINYFLNDDGGPYWLRHAEAVALDCSAIVSIHLNSGGGTGTESLIHNLRANVRSRALQETIHPCLIKGTGLRDRGMKTQEVSVLGGELPAVLLEVGFIDNASDMATLKARKQTIIDQIAEGIAEFRKKH